MPKPDEIAARLLRAPYEALDERAKKVARHIAGHTHIARNLAKEFDARPSLGQRAADAVASFGGSWTFVGLFAATMLGWVGVNAFLLCAAARPSIPIPTSC